MTKDNKEQKLSDSTKPAIAYTPCYKLLKFAEMKHEFIYKLDIKNLLYLHEQIESALQEKDTNEIVDYMKQIDKVINHIEK